MGKTALQQLLDLPAHQGKIVTITAMDEGISDQAAINDIEAQHRNEPHPNMPALVRVLGQITAIGSDPPSVTVKSQEVETTYSATDQQVETAVQFGPAKVVALGVKTGDQLRLLWLRSEEQALATQDACARLRAFKRDWSQTLEILGS